MLTARHLALGLPLLLCAPAIVFADTVVADDQIVQGSERVGLDCVVNESFGFDTLRLKDNSPRIRFYDTSTAPDSRPTTGNLQPTIQPRAVRTIFRSTVSPPAVCRYFASMPARRPTVCM